MDCKTAGLALDRYLDDELPRDVGEKIERHIATCAQCERLVQQERAWREGVRHHIDRFAAPERLSHRIEATLDAMDQTTRRRSVATPGVWALGRGWAMAASLLLAVALSSGVTAYVSGLRTEDPVVQELVASHVRSLMVDHLTDVASSDQHTVKPWFNGKLDFTPPVEDLASEGFPLVGGRLDYIDRRPVVALVYRHRQHPINLFIRPSANAAATPISLSQNGYNLLHWSEGNFDFWAASDLNAAELQDFRKLIHPHG